MNIRVLKDKIAVRPLVKMETDSGIALATQMSQPTYHGKVVAVGPGEYETSEYDEEGKPTKQTDKFVEMQVQVGDIVIYPKDCGENLVVDNETLYVIHEVNVLAVIKE